MSAADRPRAGMNVSGLLTRAARSAPTALALRQGDESLSYAALSERVARLALGLRQIGLRPGDRVGIIQRNGPRLVESLLAAMHGGFIAVPVNARSTPYETRDLAADSDPAAWLFGPEFSEHVAELPGLHIAASGADAKHTIEGLIEGASTCPPPDEVAADQPAWLFYTSGTTGRMKGATLTHRNLLAMTQAFLGDIRAYPPDAKVLHAAPLTHGSGLYALPPIARAAAQVITSSPSFDPNELLDAVARDRVTAVAFLAPTMVNRMVEAQVAAPRDLSALSDIVYGGAPMYGEDIQRALHVLGPVLHQIYGQAEAPVTIARLTAADHARALANDPELLQSVGQPYTTVDVAVQVDSEVHAVGEGEVLARGDVVMAGYWHNDDATDTALEGGWLHTGDVARIDERGYVHLLDRNKDVIITGGANVYPREVEEVLLLHPRVREVAVVGAPDQEWGERVVAVLSLVDSLDPGDADQLKAELLATCRARLSGYKLPRQLDVVGELPKSPYGKILKREVRDTYWSGHERQI